MGICNNRFTKSWLTASELRFGFCLRTSSRSWFMEFIISLKSGSIFLPFILSVKRSNSSSMIFSTKKSYHKEIKIFVDIFNSNATTPHYKLRPGEKIRIRLRGNTGVTSPNKNILFEMPIISLRPHILFHENKKNSNLPLLVFSPKGKPAREN